MAESYEQTGSVATEAQPSGRVPMAVVRWAATTKIHVTADGVKTACGVLIPARVRRTVPTVDWHLHTNCYNCAYRLWPVHGPADYLCPINGKDFPVQRRCPHGDRTQNCVRCTPRAAQCWPCPNGCTDPLNHNPSYRFTTCTVHPPRRQLESDERCTTGCQSTELVMHRANPKLHFDLADSAVMTCYHCGEYVCVACQTAPVDSMLSVCDPCAERAIWLSAAWADRPTRGAKESSDERQG